MQEYRLGNSCRWGLHGCFAFAVHSFDFGKGIRTFFCGFAVHQYGDMRFDSSILNATWVF